MWILSSEKQMPFTKSFVMKWMDDVSRNDAWRHWWQQQLQRGPLGNCQGGYNTVKSKWYQEAKSQK